MTCEWREIASADGISAAPIAVITGWKEFAQTWKIQPEDELHVSATAIGLHTLVWLSFMHTFIFLTK